MWGGGGARGSVSKKFFSALRASVWSQIKRCGWGAGLRHWRKFRTGDHDKMAWKLASKLDSDETKNT